MTRSYGRSTLLGMPVRSLRYWCLLVCFGCDGGYVLGDRRTDAPMLAGQGGEPSEAGTGNEGAALAGAGQTGEGGAGGVAASLTLTPTSLPAARLQRAYLAQFAARGGQEPYEFSLHGGQLPPGLSLESDGRLHGAPLEHGAFTFLLRATDAESTTVELELALSVERSRWMATQTFPSSASTQTLLNLSDLREPDSEPIRIESQSAHGYGFSPDGRWLIYNSFRSLEEVDQYIVDTAGDSPSERQFLLTKGYYAQDCEFSPSGSKLACLRSVAEQTELVWVATSGAEVGPVQTLATTARFSWIDDENIAFETAASSYSQVSWTSGEPGEPEPLPVTGTIELQSSDGWRARVADDDTTTPDWLQDLRTGESASLPVGAFMLSDDFEFGVSYQPAPQPGEPDLMKYRFYAIDGVDCSLLGETVATHHAAFGPTSPFIGNKLWLVKGDQVSLVVLHDSDYEELVVPGSFSIIRNVRAATNGRWLYIETAELNANESAFLPETTKHWLSRVEDEEPAQLLAEGFVSGEPLFSPDGQRFKLNGYDSYADTPVPFYLFDLTSPEEAQRRVLDIPLNWAETGWSNDSSFVWFLGGSPTRSSRILFSVDALAPETPPRTIFECFDNPSPLPGCPNGTVFQP